MPKEWGNGNIKMVIIFLNFNVIMVTCITVDQEISCENWALIVLQPDRDIGYVLKKDRNKINGKENGRHERNRSKSTWRWWGLREKMVDTEAKVGMWQSCGLVILFSPDPTTTLRILVCSPVCPQRLTPTHHVTWVSVPLVFSGVVPKGTQSEIERQEENIIVSITLPAFFLSMVWKCPCFSTCHLSFC